jgi:general stress protein 26
MSTGMSNDTETSFESFLDILQRFEVAIVVTRDMNGTLRGRPLAIADRTHEGNLWFLTHVDSATIDDITENPEIAACLQADGCYLSISGLARATRDRSRIDALWSPDQSVWYELGKDDPSLILLEIVPTYAEYWDRSGASGIRFKLRELSAMLSGETVEKTAGIHGDVDFDERPRDS